VAFVGADSLRSIKLPRSILRTAAAAVAALGALALVIGFGTSAGRAALSAAERSLEFRFGYWRATLAMIRDYPLFGVGPGQFQDYYATYKLPAASEVVQDPHNWLLEVWATAGTPAAILLIAMLGAVIGQACRAGGETVVEKDGSRSTTSYAAMLGGLAGVAVGVAIAWLSGFPVARIHMLLIVVGIVGAWWLWRGWVEDGVLSRRLPVIAAIALLVNLLAAGGISYPSVAGSLVLLLAIELNLTDHVGNQSVERLFQTRFGRWGSCVALAALLAAAIWSEYQPVMGCRLQLSVADAALAAGRADQSRTALEAAVAADPWSPEAASRLAAQRFADYQALPTPTQRRSLIEADETARRLAPHRSSAWAQSAEFAAAIHSHTSSVEDFDAAQSYYERAIELFPSNAELRLRAAKFWQANGKLDRARQAAAEAIRLDDWMRAGGDTSRLLDVGQRQEAEAIMKQTN
jgi:tetratricopeptide (TPR) repeat protein